MLKNASVARSPPAACLWLHRLSARGCCERVWALPCSLALPCNCRRATLKPSWAAARSQACRPSPLAHHLPVDQLLLEASLESRSTLAVMLRRLALCCEQGTRRRRAPLAHCRRCVAALFRPARTCLRLSTCFAFKDCHMCSCSLRLCRPRRRPWRQSPWACSASHRCLRQSVSTARRRDAVVAADSAELNQVESHDTLISPSPLPSPLLLLLLLPHQSMRRLLLSQSMRCSPCSRAAQHVHAGAGQPFQPNRQGREGAASGSQLGAGQVCTCSVSLLPSAACVPCKPGKA